MLIFGCINADNASKEKTKPSNDLFEKKALPPTTKKDNLSLENNTQNNKTEKKYFKEAVCNYEMKEGKAYFKGIMYIKGDKSRVEVNYTIPGKNDSAVIIIKEGKSYFKSLTTELPCGWIEVDYDNSLNPEIPRDSEILGKNIEKKEGITSISYECVEKKLDDKLFEVEGKVCSLEDLMNS